MLASTKKSTKSKHIASAIRAASVARNPSIIAQWIAPRYLDPKKLRKAYTSARPFPHLSLPGFLREERARALGHALQSEGFIRKESDLFKLAQTSELKHTTNPTIHNFRAFLLSKEFTEYLRTLTGLPLTGKELDLAGARYNDTDFLLCHDDRVTGRKIAFIIYLGDKFSQKDGGALALHTDRAGKPGPVVKRIYPDWNMINLFTVSKKSWHTVEEITARKDRLSIGGWFH